MALAERGGGGQELAPGRHRRLDSGASGTSSGTGTGGGGSLENLSSGPDSGRGAGPTLSPSAGDGGSGLFIVAGGDDQLLYSDGAGGTGQPSGGVDEESASSFAARPAAGAPPPPPVLLSDPPQPINAAARSAAGLGRSAAAASSRPAGKKRWESLHAEIEAASEAAQALELAAPPGGAEGCGPSAALSGSRPDSPVRVLVPAAEEHQRGAPQRVPSPTPPPSGPAAGAAFEASAPGDLHSRTIAPEEVSCSTVSVGPLPRDGSASDRGSRSPARPWRRFFLLPPAADASRDNAAPAGGGAFSPARYSSELEPSAACQVVSLGQQSLALPGEEANEEAYLEMSPTSLTITIPEDKSVHFFRVLNDSGLRLSGSAADGSGGAAAAADGRRLPHGAGASSERIPAIAGHTEVKVVVVDSADPRVCMDSPAHHASSPNTDAFVQWAMPLSPASSESPVAASSRRRRYILQPSPPGGRAQPRDQEPAATESPPPRHKPAPQPQGAFSRLLRRISASSQSLRSSDGATTTPSSIQSRELDRSGGGEGSSFLRQPPPVSAAMSTAAAASAREQEDSTVLVLDVSTGAAGHLELVGRSAPPPTEEDDLAIGLDVTQPAAVSLRNNGVGNSAGPVPSASSAVEAAGLLSPGAAASSSSGTPSSQLRLSPQQALAGGASRVSATLAGVPASSSVPFRERPPAVQGGAAPQAEAPQPPLPLLPPGHYGASHQQSPPSTVEPVGGSASSSTGLQRRWPESATASGRRQAGQPSQPPPPRRPHWGPLDDRRLSSDDPPTMPRGGRPAMSASDAAVAVRRGGLRPPVRRCFQHPCCDVRRGKITLWRQNRAPAAAHSRIRGACR